MRLALAAVLQILILTVATAAATAQTGSVSGEVRDAETGAAIAQANVVLEGTQLGTSSDPAGRYILRRLPSGEATLVVSFVGYEPVRRSISLEPGAQLQVDFELRRRDVEAAEILVEAEQPLERARAIGFQEIPILLVKQIPSAIEDDLFRSLQLLPGVKAASDFSSGLYIRGGSPDQTLILLDQVPLYNPSHFFGFFSIFNVDAIDDVQIWKGGYPKRYGGRLGSVIDVSTRAPGRERVGGLASIGLLASRLSLDGPVRLAGRDGGFLIAARRSTLEPLLAVLRRTEETLPEAFHFYDANARAELDLSDRDRVALSFYAGMDDVLFPFAENALFELRYGNRLATARYRRFFTDRFSATLHAGASRYWNYPFAEVSGTTFRRENSITDYSLDADALWLLSDAVTLRGGLRGGRLSSWLQDTFDGRVTYQAERQIPYGAAFTEASWRLEPWVLSAGIRGEYFSRGRHLQIGPRLAAERYLGENVLLQAAFGRYHQALSLVSNEAFSGFDVWVTAAEGVPPTYGDQITLGLKTRPAPGLAFDVEVYYRTMRDLFELDPRLPDITGADYADLFRTGEGYATGLELLLERGRGRLTGFVAYTLGFTERRFTGSSGEAFNPDPETGEARPYSPKYDRTHDLAAVASYDLGRAWSVTGSFVYATGQPYTRVTGHYEVPTLPGKEPGAVVTSGLNRARLPPYHRADLGVTRTGPFFVGGDYELRIQAINVYSRRNLWFYFLDQRANPIAIEPARQLPILPNVSFSLTF
jgi:hypothetical protein